MMRLAMANQRKRQRLVATFLSLAALLSPIEAFALPAALTVAPDVEVKQDSRAKSRTSFVSSQTKLGVSSAASAVAATSNPVGAGSYWLARSIFLRALGFVYGTAFLVALRQNKALIGDKGITPARHALKSAYERGKTKRRRREEWLKLRQNYPKIGDKDELNPAWYWLRNTRLYRKAEDVLDRSTTYCSLRETLYDRSDRMDRPLLSLLYLAKNKQNIDPWLDGMAKAGIVMSAFLLTTGAANVPMLFALWLCQRSIMSVGNAWYGFGWEPQLAELGFHAMFLVPLLSLKAIPASAPVPMIVIWTIRCHLFRIMLGAGLIKIKSNDKKWRDLTAMDVFYETQPVPNPFTKYFHATPKIWHKFEVLTNHFVELVAPWLLILPGLPRQWRITGGLIQLVFQSVLISSGNLSFLNWLTAVPAVLCLDDAFLMKIFYPFKTSAEAVAAYSSAIAPSVDKAVPLARNIVSVAFAVLIAKLSIPVVQNLLARRQIMNGSFDRYRLINTFGAFGSVSEVREELIIESADNVAGPWREYVFKVKPGPLSRSCPWISPYHYRLDWLMWIACVCGGIERSPWLLKLLLKLLQQDEGVLSLLDSDPWANEKTDEGKIKKMGESCDTSDPWEFSDDGSSGDEERPRGPKYIRIEKYRYEFNYDRSLKDENGKQLYWKRERVGRYFPLQGVVTKEILMDII
jgi:hypothetical protein